MNLWNKVYTEDEKCISFFYSPSHNSLSVLSEQYASNAGKEVSGGLYLGGKKLFS